MAEKNRYELHLATIQAEGPTRIEDLRWREGDRPSRAQPLCIGDQEDAVWANLDEQQGNLKRVNEPENALIGLCVVSRGPLKDLVLITESDRVWVNGVPALGLTVLGPKDSVLFEHNRLFYVTRRVESYAGPPLEPMLGQPCRVCGIHIKSKTRVFRCTCNEIYHDETEESHPDRPDDDRLDCAGQAKKCYHCGHELTPSDFLLWDPEEL